MSKFISLKEYAYRYQVSAELLRRKIQKKQIEFIFSNGEYLIESQPFEEKGLVEDKNCSWTAEDPEIQLKEALLQLEKKKIEIEKLRSEYEDLKNVFHFLEKENAQMKNIILGLQRMDEFISSENSALLKEK